MGMVVALTSMMQSSCKIERDGTKRSALQLQSERQLRRGAISVPAGTVCVDTLVRAEDVYLQAGNESVWLEQQE